MTEKDTFHVVDLHCDLTHYLVTVDGATPNDTHDIGCGIPYLKQGMVSLQVMALSSVEKTPSAELSLEQLAWYKKLLTDFGDTFLSFTDSGRVPSDKVGIVPAIENASVLCGLDDPLDDAFARLEEICGEIGRPLYISLTHHAENRFGGGNMSDIGLKDDGRRLLEYIDGKRIAVDFSHTSDALAHNILDHIDARGLSVPVMASHSNFRQVFDHRRNLPDELAKEVIRRKGLIGMNFLRAFMHPEDPGYLVKHIVYGLEMGGAESIAIGADYFHTGTHPDPTRMPFFFEQYEHAGKYQSVLADLARELGRDKVEAIASGNALRFMQRSYL